MTAITNEKKIGARFVFSVALLGLLTLIGVALAVYRLFVGLGPTTNLNDHFPWGVWIMLDLFLIPIGGAAFTISAISHFFDIEDYHKVVRPAVLTGFLCYSLVGAILLMDLGRWHQFYNVLIPPYMNIHSFLLEIALCVTFYLVILTLEVAPTILERWNLTNIERLIDRAMLIVAGAGIVLSTLHQSSIGSMFLLMRHNLSSIWWTELLPLLFFTQAVFGGLAMAVVVFHFTWKGLGKPVDKKLLVSIGKVIRVVLLLYFIVRLADWLIAGDLGLLFKFDYYSIIILVEIITGMIVPLALLFSKLGNRAAGVFWASVWILIGLFIERLMVTWVGMEMPAWSTYTPHWMEIVLSIGFLAGGVLVYMLVAHFFELLPEGH